MISDSNDAYSPDVEVIATTTSTGLPASFGGDDTTELPFALRDDAQDQEEYFDWFGSKRSKIIVGLITFLLVLCISTGTGIAVKNNTVKNFAVLEEDCPEPLLISSTNTKGSKAPSTAKAKSKAPSSAAAEGGTKAHTTPGSKCSKSTKSSKSSKSSAPSSQPSLAPSESVKPSTKPSLVPSGSPSTKPSLRPSESPSAKPSLIPSAKPSLGPSAKPSLGPSAKPSLGPSAKPSLGPTFLSTTD